MTDEAASDSVDDPLSAVSPDSPHIQGLCSDARRSVHAMLRAFIAPSIALAIMLTVARPHGHWGAVTVGLCLAWFNIYVLVYSRLTWNVFARVDAETFHRRMRTREERRRPRMKRLLPNGDGPSFAISSTMVAFTVVLVIPHVQGIQVDDWVLVPISLTILLACWGLSVLSYALHYAQHDLDVPSLDFPGTRTGAFQDYLYFALAVATTFGATDVNVTTPQMRRAVNVNVVVAFLFNSVVVALLASILIR